MNRTIPQSTIRDLPRNILCSTFQMGSHNVMSGQGRIWGGFIVDSTSFGQGSYALVLDSANVDDALESKFLYALNEIIIDRTNRNDYVSYNL